MVHGEGSNFLDVYSKDCMSDFIVNMFVVVGQEKKLSFDRAVPWDVGHRILRDGDGFRAGVA